MHGRHVPVLTAAGVAPDCVGGLVPDSGQKPPETFGAPDPTPLFGTPWIGNVRWGSNPGGQKYCWLDK